ncbi:MAG TPA: TIGR01212 family radical SAM protein [Prolixibacteraceae bacterium]|jgi:hypothetical protein|nr:TIGR01212 family radical SAM protein [Prolixibacteraceae bacterium]HNU77424.1 TIGR01212 family radical SAM protein [Prolixibacteraceae bacterium]HNZ69770.1 TIGR01212 family radical SAM protein [Prolixibacteraceae bacterium]HOC86758.1 TIGR01212 family radical SAM protein [Prolixibacteraceae bacterium]HOG96673.1 TIGR01212 family radical SAM protein [Prolixibacteraceae bacterium]
MRQFPWGHIGRYNNFQFFFRKVFKGEKVQKISLESGLTCPNRDGLKGEGGCTYCNNEAFTPPPAGTHKTIAIQMEEGIRFFAHKYPTMKYLAYFQSYSNTYAPLPALKEIYGEALAFPRVAGLVISTRPDCLDEGILDYLADLSGRTYLMLELGLESHLDVTLERINRGHTFAESAAALEAASRRGIRITAHMILGLPGETREDWLEQARVISRLPVDNLKLHQMQIHKGTVMARQYRNDPSQFRLFTAEEYASLVVEYLELLNPLITVERFTSQAPAELLIAPAWGIKNYEFSAIVEKLLEQRNTWQGRLFLTSDTIEFFS